MKRLLFLVGFIALTFLSCKKEESAQPTQQIQAKTVIPFTGKWIRQFEAGPGNLHDVTYNIYQDSIRYTLTGPVGNADYVLIRDTFLLADNRFIGHTPTNQFYLLFVKTVGTDSVTIYKQDVLTIQEGMGIAVPHDSTTAYHGWQTYHK